MLEGEVVRSEILDWMGLWMWGCCCECQDLVQGNARGDSRVRGVEGEVG